MGEPTGGWERRAVAEAGRADMEAFAVVSSAGNGDGGSDLGGSGGWPGSTAFWTYFEGRVILILLVEMFD